MNMRADIEQHRLSGPTGREALQGLRQSADFTRLQQLQSPADFCNRMFLLLGRNLAVAAAMLPPEKRQEGVITFLCCRVLDAHEDLHADGATSARHILAAMEYLTGKITTPPPAPIYEGNRETDRLEALLSDRLPWLRQALEALPRPQQTRVSTLLTRIAVEMANDRAKERFGGQGHMEGRLDGNLAEYGRNVLGRIVQYSLELLEIDIPLNLDFKPIGQILQILNHIRDFAEDNERQQQAGDGPVIMLKLLLELVETSTTTPHALGKLHFAQISGERAAISYMVATGVASICKQLKVPAPWLAAHPLLSARAARYSQSFFNYLLGEIDSTLLALVTVLLQREAGHDNLPVAVYSSGGRANALQEAFELSIAEQHPDTATAIRLQNYIRLSRFSLAILDNLPTHRISGLPHNHIEGRRIMISDYFFAAAASVVCEIGPRELALFSRVGAALIEDRESGRGIDELGRTAAAVTEVVLQAQRCSAQEINAAVERNRAHSVALFARRRRRNTAFTTLIRLLSLLPPFRPAPPERAELGFTFAPRSALADE
ncbi:MAG TPA: squalene/phytoene synthase family protein [Dongiaceae bacterium]|nr:squalene/phytoene synthase family protein [Dongiaceae bacterium]